MRKEAHMNADFDVIRLSDEDAELECFRSNGSDKFFHKNVVFEITKMFERLGSKGVNIAQILKGEANEDELGSAATSRLYREYVQQLASLGIVGYLIMPIILL